MVIVHNNIVQLNNVTTNYEFIISAEWYIVSYVTSDKGTPWPPRDASPPAVGGGRRAGREGKKIKTALLYRP